MLVMTIRNGTGFTLWDKERRCRLGHVTLDRAKVDQAVPQSRGITVSFDLSDVVVVHRDDAKERKY